MLTVLLTLWLQSADVNVRAGATDVAVRCLGTRAAGQPLVLLEAGGGDDLTVWSLVQQPISQFERVCAYSRPTLIRKDVGPRANGSPTQVVQTLREVLAGLHEAPPYIMVGHSYGGMTIDCSAAEAVFSDDAKSLSRWAVRLPVFTRLANSTMTTR